ncbi:MAG: YifB family Mg chelatase-like AAA ATPase [Eubacteriales bacterium]
MLSKINTMALHGLFSYNVAVEVDLLQGLPNFTMVGLADTTVKEARERIHSAIVNSGYDFPRKRITVNLSPANRRKTGSHFDLPIAVAILVAMGEIVAGDAVQYAFFGELSLDGKVNAVTGALPLAMGAVELGIRKVFIPKENLKEVSLVKDIEIYPVSKLSEVVEHFSNDKKEPYKGTREWFNCEPYYDMDFSDVVGQEVAKRAILISCAGAHGIFMMGAPGVGKSMLAKRIPTVMPQMSYEECLEVTKIYSIGGKLDAKRPLITQRPFRAPHHTITATALIGGGNRPMPGELSLAHLGTLFIDEIAEYKGGVLDMLRQPLEDKQVNIVRNSGSYSFPCDIMLVAASNPCLCGYYGSPDHECTCSPVSIKNYQSRLSGPLMDRIDLHIWVQSVKYKDLSQSGERGMNSEEMRNIVKRSREIQEMRYKNIGIRFNAQLDGSNVRKYCNLDADGERLMEQAFSKMKLSGRGYSKILKIARTIADIDESKNIKVQHLSEALSYRQIR